MTRLGLDPPLAWVGIKKIFGGCLVPWAAVYMNEPSLILSLDLIIGTHQPQYRMPLIKWAHGAVISQLFGLETHSVQAGPG